MKILQERDNLLFKRKEIKLVLNSEKAPARSEIADSLAKKFNTSTENVKIKKIKGNFGTDKFDIEANIYESADEKNIVEVKKKKENPKEAK